MSNICKVLLKGQSPMVQGRQHFTPKLPKEGHDAYEQRTWRRKANIAEQDGKEIAVVPACALKNMCAFVAKRLGEQVPGKGKATYTKHFTSGIQVTQDCPIIIPTTGEAIAIEDIPPLVMSVPSDGVSGSGKRVQKTFPIFPANWQIEATFLILDDVITPSVFLHHLQEAGTLVGLGSFRVANGGTYGLFEVLSFDWKTYKSSYRQPKIVIDGVEQKAA